MTPLGSFEKTSVRLTVLMKLTLTHSQLEICVQTLELVDHGLGCDAPASNFQDKKELF